MTSETTSEKYKGYRDITDIINDVILDIKRKEVLNCQQKEREKKRRETSAN